MNHYLIIVIYYLLLIFTLISCNQKARKVTCQGKYYDNVIPTMIFQNGRNVVNSYLYVYGAGMQEKLFPKGDSLSPDSTFILPLNIKSGASKFCFVRKDLSIDTMEISYWREFEVGLDEKCYSCFTKEHQLQSLSLGFNRDSSYFKDPKTYTGTYLVLTLK